MPSRCNRMASLNICVGCAGFFGMKSAPLLWYALEASAARHSWRPPKCCWNRSAANCAIRSIESEFRRARPKRRGGGSRFENRWKFSSDSEIAYQALFAFLRRAPVCSNRIASSTVVNSEGNLKRLHSRHLCPRGPRRPAGRSRLRYLGGRWAGPRSSAFRTQR